MDFYKILPIIGTLVGTILGFLLSWVKDFMQNKPKLKCKFRSGEFYYYREVISENGFYSQEQVQIEQAEKLYLSLRFDIFNVGKVGTGVTDVSIKLQTKFDQRYFFPKLRIPIDKKEYEDIAFNVDSGKVQTVESELIIENDDEYSFLFEDISLNPDDKGRLRIYILVDGVGNSKVKLEVEPIAIYRLGYCNENDLDEELIAG